MTASRYAVIATFLAGIVMEGMGLLHRDAPTLELARPVLVAPTFLWVALVGVAVPLFNGTMAS